LAATNVARLATMTTIWITLLIVGLLYGVPLWR
jgi:hypothetical protein